MPFDNVSQSTAPTSVRNVLPRRRTLVLEDREGTVIAVESGCLWITMERDSRDIILVAGMRFEIDRSGRTIIAAEEDSRFRLLSTPTWRAQASAWAIGIARRLRARRRHASARRWVPYY